MYYQCCASSPLGLWIFSFVPMLHSRQARRLSLFGLLLALSLVHVSPPAQAGVEPGGIDPVGVAVVLEPSPVEPPTVELSPVPEPPPVPKPPAVPEPPPSPPEPPPPPASREIQGELTPDRPTIVLTHGLEADAASLWTGFSATPGAQGAGHILNNLLGQQVNIVQFLWEEGLQAFRLATTARPSPRPRTPAQSWRIS
jgi:hypothetical protein